MEIAGIIRKVLSIGLMMVLLDYDYGNCQMMDFTMSGEPALHYSAEKLRSLTLYVHSLLADDTD